MPITDLGKPKINILFQGFFVSRIKDGNPVADIGALGGSVCHTPRITLFRNANDGFPPTIESALFDIEQNIEIKVEKTERKTIQEFRSGQFTRNSDSNDRSDFRWVVDINKEVLDGREFPVVPGKLKPIISVNSAIFYTELLSKSPLLIKRPGKQPEMFGRIAEHFGANIYFTSSQSKAVISNGGRDVLTVDQSEPGITYQLLINCHCQQQLAISDFPEVFNVLGGVPAELRADLVPPDQPGTLPGGPIQGGDVPCSGCNVTHP